MKDLQQLQAYWLDALLDDEKPKAFLARFDESKIPIDVGIAVYQSSMRASLMNHLQEAYAICQRLVGETFWQALLSRYIGQTPSRHGDIAHYGADLPHFLAEFDPTKELKYLPDVARLEWAWHRCFYAEDVAPFDCEKFASLREDEILQCQFVLNPSLQVIASPYPIYTIWQVNYEERDDEIDLDQSGETAVVWQQGLTTHMQALSSIEVKWLALIENGTDWAHSAEMLSKDDTQADLQTLLSEAISKAWITGFNEEGTRR